MANLVVWQKFRENEWRGLTDHYHTARIQLFSDAWFARGGKVYAITYGVSHIADAYTLKDAKAAAVAYATQEGWL